MTETELNALLAGITPANEAARAAAHAHWASLAKPLGGLGRLETMLEDAAALTGSADLDLSRRVVVVLCADNGVVAQGVSQTGQEVTRAVAENLAMRRTSVCQMARAAHCDVVPVDMGMAGEPVPGVRSCRIAAGTADFTKGPAMTREQAEMALERGMKVAGECIDKGYNMLVTAEMGIGNTTSTAAIVSAFTGLASELTVGRGTGINDERMKVKRQVVADGLAVNKPELGNAMDILCKVGGYDHAGLAGMIIEGARRRVPTMVDGVNATAAALLAYGIEPACADYMFCSHLSAEISHAKMVEILNLKPIVDAGMRLGEGTGASLAIVILQSALDLYKNLTAGEQNA